MIAMSGASRGYASEWVEVGMRDKARNKDRGFAELLSALFASLVLGKNRTLTVWTATTRVE